LKPLLQYNTENAPGKGKAPLPAALSRGKHVGANKKAASRAAFFEKSILIGLPHVGPKLS